MPNPLSKCSPFTKQFIVSLGSAFNIMGVGTVSAFGSVLLPQLRTSQFIPLDMEQESWIVSITGFANILGTMMAPTIMDKYGRRFANLMSISIITVTWFTIVFAADYYSLLIIRFFQGFALGIPSIMASVLIGEYSSPKYRGVFLTTISLSIASGVLAVHSLGSFLHWKIVTVICGLMSVLNLTIVILSPESPSFLASHDRYDECRTAFHWLRGFDDDEELEKMIKTNMLMKSKDDLDHSNRVIFKVKKKVKGMNERFRRKEFYKPIILMLHLYVINEWSGAAVLDSFTRDILEKIVDTNIDIRLVIISTDIQRIMTNVCAIIVIKYVRRRIMLLTTVGLNVIAYLLIAAYVYAKSHLMLPFDHPGIGIGLVHLHVFSFAMGNCPLPSIIAGEIYPLEYRSFASMIVMLFFTVNIIVNMKTALSLFSTFGIHGAYCIYAGIIAYSLVVTSMMLPETKDRTLQDIEEEFSGKSMLPDDDLSDMLVHDNKRDRSNLNGVEF